MEPRHPMKINDFERQSIAIVLILGVISFFYARGVQSEIKKNARIEEEIERYEKSLQPLLSLALNAKGFAIYDTNTKQFFYKKNAQSPMPLASLAKVMSAMIIMENVPVDHIFKISKDSLSQAGDNKLLVDEKWKRDELLKFTLVESSNDAIRQMAIETGSLIDPEALDPLQAFVKKMNEKALALGFRSMRFTNESGLDTEFGENGAYASARDMAKLFALAVETYPDIFTPTIKSAPVITSLDKEHVAKNTNPIVEDIPGIIASKTGFTNISGGNLAVMVPGHDGHILSVVVLGSTFDERFVDVEKISGALSQ